MSDETVSDTPRKAGRPKGGEPKEQITFQLSKKVMNEVRERAEAEGNSIASIARRALTRGLGAESAELS